MYTLYVYICIYIYTYTYIYIYIYIYIHIHTYTGIYERNMYAKYILIHLQLHKRIIIHYLQIHFAQYCQILAYIHI